MGPGQPVSVAGDVFSDTVATDAESEVGCRNRRTDGFTPGTRGMESCVLPHEHCRYSFDTKLHVLVNPALLVFTCFRDGSDQ